jgi:hypothetical protein
MKTTSTPVFNSSGYPVLVTAAANEQMLSKEEPKTAEQRTDATVKKPSKLFDVPENWDETWFANYE